MAESTFPSLRTALNHALSGFRPWFGRNTPPAKEERREAEPFLTRLEEVLGIDLLAVESCPQGQETEPALDLEPVSVVEFSGPVELIDPPGTSPKAKRRVATKSVVGEKRGTQSAARRKPPGVFV